MFNPTAEQIQILEHFEDALKSRNSLVVQAGAGTGKTSTLQLLSESTKLQGQYLAFNKAIVEESKKKFPKNVQCNTAHSLAWSEIMKPNKGLQFRLRNSARMPSWEIANLLDIKAHTWGEHTVSANRLASITMRMVTNFCNSADDKISYKHCPYLEGLDPLTDEGKRTYTVNNQVAAFLVPYAEAAWEDVNSRNGQLPFKHEHYLKMYQLSEPKIDAEFILFDEAQDANPVMQAIVAKQTHATIVWVGDSQQQIYSFTGAVNALEEIEKLEGTRTAFLTQSFRFGQAVADVANEVLSSLPKAQLRLKGFDQINSVVAELQEPDVYLTRTNAAAVEMVFMAQENGRKPYLVGGGKEILSFAKAAQNLKQGKKVEHPDLACFETWQDVLDYVETDEQGDELKLNVMLVQRFGEARIMAALLNCSTETQADLVISTAHKAKGREWNNVQLGPDFPEQYKAGEEERRLLYVAVTRAKITLDITRVRYFGGEPVEEV
jgi:superfamily I DNA/RNA helicase